jgi:ribosomal protein L40E
VEQAASPLLLLRADLPTRQDRPAEEERQAQDTLPREAIFCRACGGMVTDRGQKISVGGSHTHTFFNPAGIVYELGCFHQAAGCVISGLATAEFSWFAGHLWRFALCRRCQAHLGWFFEMGEKSFFGLILARLREG